MPLATIEVRGERKTWVVNWHASQEQIDAMREDGITVDTIHNIIPGWIADLGLGRPWCFLQDIWNFRNPL